MLPLLGAFGEARLLDQTAQGVVGADASRQRGC